MTRFRPCIDLHAGSVKQIVGGTLTASNPSSLTTNHVSSLPAEHFAQLYKTLNLQGAHIIKLGPGNDLACEAALEAWPGHLQVGGGITAENAGGWIAKGAGKVRK
jgi:phosphoribosylformimino-5-aminoimidazole carboxamide ribotide isomerase